MVNLASDCQTTDMFEQLVDSAPVLFYAVDADLRYTNINPFFAKVHNIRQEDAIGKQIPDVIGQAGFDNNAHHYERVLRGQKVQYESFFTKADGSPHHYCAIYKPLLNDDGVAGFTGVVLDTTAQKQMEQLSNTDSLTQVANRRKFEATLQALLDAPEDGSHGLLLMDIDDFKAINDGYGHIQGDQTLIALSKLFSGEIRDEDSVYRIGGEEFAVILHGLKDRTAATRRSDSPRRRITPSP